MYAFNIRTDTRLNVDKRQIDNGFLLVCRGANSRSHFKVILFDLVGEILFEEICIKPIKVSYTEAAIYFTRFETYSLGSNNTTSTSNNSNDVLPRLFSALDNFQPSKKTLFPGQYLLCIQCTNILGLPTNFTITVVPSNNTLTVVNEIEEIDEAIITFKSTVDEVKQEYLNTKAAYEQSLLKVKQQEEQLSNLLEVRDKSYNLFIEGSIKVFKPILDNDLTTTTSATTSHSSNTTNQSLSSDFSATNPINSTSNTTTGDATTTSSTTIPNSSSTNANEQHAPTITAATLAANAAKTATEAWGGLTRRFSLGMSHVKPILFSTSGGTVTSSVMNNSEGCDSDYNSSVGASDESVSGDVTAEDTVGAAAVASNTSNTIVEFEGGNIASNMNSSIDSPLDSIDVVSTSEYSNNNNSVNNSHNVVITSNTTTTIVDNDVVTVEDLSIAKDCDITSTIITPVLDNISS